MGTMTKTCGGGRKAGKEAFGAKTRGPSPKYLLPGLEWCSMCGGMIHVARTRKSYETVAAYICSKWKNIGQRVKNMDAEPQS